MRKRDLFLPGMATGSTVGLLMSIVTRIPLGSDQDGNQITFMYELWSACFVIILVPLMSAFSVRFLSQKLASVEPGMEQLIPVAFLTFFIPVLGPIFGGTGAMIEIPIVTLMGALGGAFWTSPYVLWNHFKTNNSESES